MIDPTAFYRLMIESGVSFFAGVPDSLLKSLCACIDEHSPSGNHVITANEGNAVGLAAGFYLGCNKPAVVYMQNSGIGNALNPLASLCDREVYSIPMLLIIGWRGEPGVHDEPQHIKQGRIIRAQLEIAEIPYRILGPDTDYEAELPELLTLMTRGQSPVALLVQKDTFSEYRSLKKKSTDDIMTREEALSCILENTYSDDLFISTTGKTSRELFELRKKRGEAPHDFLTVGSMGHTSSIALGVAIANPERRVICLDGDGSLLMHMGALPIIASQTPKSLIHVVINNGAHESVGGQATVARSINFALLAEACGYARYFRAASQDEIANVLKDEHLSAGPVLFEIMVRTGSRPDLGRPSAGPLENKAAFMDHVQRKS